MADLSRHGIAPWGAGAGLDQDLEDELAFHLAMRQQGHGGGRRAGRGGQASRGDAAIRQCHAAQGGDARHVDVPFESRASARMSRTPIRTLRRQAGFAATRVIWLVLATAIGLNTTLVDRHRRHHAAAVAGDRGRVACGPGVPRRAQRESRHDGFSLADVRSLFPRRVDNTQRTSRR